MKRILLWAVLALVGLSVAIQFVPYGRDHSNPPVQSEPDWDSPDTRALAKAACFDCHSNETQWGRWYESVAPASWLVQRDVAEGRRIVNFSEWNQGGKPRELEELWEVVAEGEMPPPQYGLMHPEARLNQDERAQLAQGLRNTVGR